MKAALDILRKLLRDPAAAAGLVIVLLLVAVAVLAPLIATHPEAVWDMNPRQRLLPPSEAYFFGTDRMGADIYSRILFGARITLTIAITAVGAALLIGVPIGLVSGWRQSWLGEALMRISDIFLAVPQIVLAIAISQTLGPSIENVILAASALGFLGLGAPPPAPEWGRMISESREFLPEAWWYALAPGLAIFLVVMGFNLLGDGLRDVLDPRIRRASTGR